MEESKVNFGEQLARLRLLAGYQSRAELAKIIGVDSSTITRLENGETSPSVDTLKKLAPVLGIKVRELMFLAGQIDDNDEEWKSFKYTLFESGTIYDKRHIVNLRNLVNVPVLGKVVAGEPMLAIQEYDEWCALDKTIHLTYGYPLDEYFCLRVDGLSMEPTIHSGEIVLVHWQNYLEPGEVGVFLCHDSHTTVKRFHVEGNTVVLMPDNKQFPAQVYSPDDCRILGKVLQSVFREIR